MTAEQLLMEMQATIPWLNRVALTLGVALMLMGFLVGCCAIAVIYHVTVRRRRENRGALEDLEALLIEMARMDRWCAVYPNVPEAIARLRDVLKRERTAETIEDFRSRLTTGKEE